MIDNYEVKARNTDQLIVLKCADFALKCGKNCLAAGLAK